MIQDYNEQHSFTGLVSCRCAAISWNTYFLRFLAVSFLGSSVLKTHILVGSTIFSFFAFSLPLGLLLALNFLLLSGKRFGLILHSSICLRSVGILDEQDHTHSTVFVGRDLQKSSTLTPMLSWALLSMYVSSSMLTYSIYAYMMCWTGAAICSYNLHNLTTRRGKNWIEITELENGLNWKGTLKVI